MAISATINQVYTDLADHQFINLTTFRKNGSSVSTPVTFARYNAKLYVVTGATAGKLKRLRHISRVELSPCDSKGNVLGPTLAGQARILSRDEAARLKPYLKLQAPAVLMFMFNLLRDLLKGGNVYLEIILEG
jgi:PPOX class probable F420-dependent enzyme